MNKVLHILPWKRGLIVSIVTLVLVIIFSFYGLYTNKFYFFKFDNYLLPLLTIVHFAFLYVLWFKIKEGEIADPQMRNLEYGLYAILLVYFYKLFDTLLILTTSGEFANHVIPATFIPLGIFIFLLYSLLISLAFLAFKYRKDHVGGYKFDDMNHIDSWE